MLFIWEVSLFKKTANYFTKWLYHLRLPSAVYKGSPFLQMTNYIYILLYAYLSVSFLVKCLFKSFKMVFLLLLQEYFMYSQCKELRNKLLIFKLFFIDFKGFLQACSKEEICNAGNLGSVPG